MAVQTQARFGMARFGASRFGYYRPNLVVLIAGTDRSTLIDDVISPPVVNMHFNGQADTATIALKRTAGIVPAINSEVIIALGHKDNREFAGQIVHREFKRTTVAQDPLIILTCTDKQRLFDRRLVTWDYSAAQSATAIALDMISRFSAGFTTKHVQAGLPTVTGFIPINLTLSEAFRELILQMGGGSFDIDPSSDVHFAGPSGETNSYTRTPPVTLINTLSTLKSWDHEDDTTQQRTRTIVEGATATIAIDVPVAAGSQFASLPAPIGSPVPQLAAGFPVDNAWPFAPSSGSVRVNGHVFTGTSAVRVLGPPSCTTTADAAIGDATIDIDSNAGMLAGVGRSGMDAIFWVKTSGGAYFFVLADSAIPTQLRTFISGYGSLTVPIASGTPLYLSHSLVLQYNLELMADLHQGDQAVVVVESDDAGAQSTVAGEEGGDGIHEFETSATNADYNGAASIGAADLAQFSPPIPNATWDTEDLNARPGAQQAINMTTRDALSTTLTITDVEITFPIRNFPPRRACRASALKLVDLIDLLTKNG